MFYNYYDFSIFKDDFKDFPILETIYKHKFKTIFDIVLENPESFYLIGFLSHMSDIGLFEEIGLDSVNDVYKSCRGSKLHLSFRHPEIYKSLVNQKVYTRVKSFNTVEFEKALVHQQKYK